MLRFLAPLLLLTALPVLAGELTFTDLSESGDAMRFQVRAGIGVTVELGATADWDVLDFEVRGAAVGQEINFQIASASQSWIPALSLIGSEWMPVTTQLVGDGIRFVVVAPRERFLVRLTDRSTVGRAAFYPWGRYTEYLGRVAASPLAQISRVGTSGQGRPLYRIVIDKPSNAEKKTVLMGVRQHGDEYGSSYLLEGALDLLLGRAGLVPEAKLLDDIRWIIYPLMNPDGAVMNIRYNASGVDLNRDWLRNGCSASQSPEIFAMQCDLEALHALGAVSIGGDHHGWGSSPDGGFRYAEGQSTSFVSGPEHDEAQKDTEVVTLHDPSQSNWMENGGTPGMLRAEMYHRFGYLLHTPEYNSGATTAAEFYVKGQAWVRAMHDTLFAPLFTDADGVERTVANLPADKLFVTVDDLDENQNAGVRESVSVTVWDVVSGDVETLSLLETGVNTGIFRNTNALRLRIGQGTPGDGVLHSVGGSLRARYIDDDYSRDKSSTTLAVTSPWERQDAPVKQP